jgi:hypothetical protein
MCWWKICDEDFAADQSQVIKGAAPELYGEPIAVFANPDPICGLKGLIKAVPGRLTGDDRHLGP